MRDTKTRDWVTPAVVVLGSASILAGLYFALKKPPGLSPREKLNAIFSFDYLRGATPYSLSVRFGYYQPFYMPFGFDEEETLGHHQLEINLPAAGSYNFTLPIVIPDGAKPGSYDAEGAILRPEMEIGKDWVTRVFNKQVLTVRKAT